MKGLISWWKDEAPCVLCGSSCTEHRYLCEDCADLLPLTGKEVESGFPEPRKIYSMGEYRGHLRKLIHRYKYEDHGYLRELFSRLLREELGDFPWFSSGAVLTYVPMDRVSEKRRGYNPVKLLAEELARDNPGVRLSDGLKKIKRTPHQVGLSKEEREKNGQGAFVMEESLFGETVILLDDIKTTGATLYYCALALKAAGAKDIIGLVLSDR